MKAIDLRLNRIIIRRGGTFGTTYLVDEWHLPGDQVEFYYVFFMDKRIATFWICNNFPDSLQLHCPMDVEFVEYILQEMKVRSFKLDKKDEEKVEETP